MRQTQAVAKLLLDIGHTRIKWARFVDGILASQQSLSHAEASDDALLRILLDSGCHQLVVANVARPDIEQRLRALTRHLGLPEALFIRTESHAFGVTNAYRHAQRLGVDRWLAMIAGRCLCQQRFYVVDAGSALTIDAINQQGLHLGGLIAPGFTNMMKALVVNTTLSIEQTLPPASLQLESNTQEAMLNGCAAAVVSLIDQQVAADAHLILTGGDAHWIAGLLDRQAEQIDDLVLRGLARYAEET